MNVEEALENSAKCINYALNLANENQKALIRKILDDLNQCRHFMNLNLNSNKNQIENADHEMQNADIVQSAQNAQNQHNEIEASRVEKEKSSNIEVRMEKTINEKMKKIQSHLDKKLNQMMNLI